MGGPDLPITVNIPSVEISKSLLCQTRSKYVVVCEAFGLRSQASRPFEDFKKFHAELTQFIRSLPSQVRMKLNYALPALPPTYFFGNELAATVEDRRAKLETFLQKLLLQPEFINDTEERLWRFLQLHPAASASARLVAARACGPWLQTLCDASLIASDGGGSVVVPLQQPLVEEALLQIVKDVIDENGSLVDGAKQSEVNATCNLLEKVCVGVMDRRRPETVLCAGVEALLLSVLCDTSAVDLKRELKRAMAELAVKQAEVEMGTKTLERIKQEKMDVTRSVSKNTEEIQRWKNAAESAEQLSSLDLRAESMSFESRANLRAHECWQRHQEATDTQKGLRDRVDELDDELRQFSEPLPALKEAVDERRLRVRELTSLTAEVRQRHASLLGDQSQVLDGRRSCGIELQGFSDCLLKARGSLDQERSQRRQLRAYIQGLVKSLEELDSQLGPLDDTLDTDAVEAWAPLGA
jgi:predicted  nucleic acid-binding Zn-ribbon protein